MTRCTVLSKLKKIGTIWIWIAICRVSKMILGFEIGDRSGETGKSLFEAIKSPFCQKYYTDYWLPYQNFLPPKKHVKSKAETYTIEGYNSLFRHYLARLHRKTKCYSKSLEMLKISLNLLINFKLNRKMVN